MYRRHSLESDSDTEGEASWDEGLRDLKEISEDLRIDTKCLLKLGSRCQECAVGPTEVESRFDEKRLLHWDMSRHFMNRINQRYPKCDTDLSERLGKASWLRVCRLQELRAKSSKVSHQTAAVSSNAKAPSTMFHDSGLGSSKPSVPTLSEYAETIVSYSGGEGGSIRVPPIPETAKDGDPFECIGCGAMVTAKTKYAWK